MGPLFSAPSVQFCGVRVDSVVWCCRTLVLGDKDTLETASDSGLSGLQQPVGSRPNPSLLCSDNDEAPQQQQQQQQPAAPVEAALMTTAAADTTGMQEDGPSVPP